jgi:glycosyltransferase involved in cell wall biosynthesis
MSGPCVTAIMPVYNEAKHLPLALRSLSRQTFDRRNFRFVAVDGGSSDSSAAILHAWLQESGITGKVLVNPERRIPVSLNLGIAQAADEDVIVRLDAHTVYGETYIADSVRALSDAPPDVACVGCAQRPARAQTFGESLVGALYTNKMGLGGTDFRFGDDVREVDNVYLGTWRPGILKALCGFNEAMEANEDAELCARLRKAGYRILRVPLPCICIMKRSPAGAIRQWHRYGYWRAKMLRRNPQSIRIRHVLGPASAIGALAVGCSPARVLLLPLYCAYAALVIANRSHDERIMTTLSTLAYFPVLQFGFAAGMLRGLAGTQLPDWPPQ